MAAEVFLGLPQSLCKSQHPTAPRRVRKRERQQVSRGVGTFGGKIGDVDGQRLPAQVGGFSICQKMHAFGDGISLEHELGAELRPQDGTVVLETKSASGRLGQRRQQTNDRRLTFEPLAVLVMIRHEIFSGRARQYDNCHKLHARLLGSFQPRGRCGSRPRASRSKREDLGAMLATPGEAEPAARWGWNTPRLRSGCARVPRSWRCQRLWPSHTWGRFASAPSIFSLFRAAVLLQMRRP